MLTAFVAAAVAIIAVIADQISKYLVVRGMDLHEERSIIDGFFSLYRTENRGAAFSMLSEKQWIFMTLSFIAMAVMVVFLIMYHKRHILMTVSLSMVLGGGIGNMIDRIRLGYVVDFLRPDFVDFATFNVADSFITVGAILLGVYVIFFEPKVEKRLKAEQEEKTAVSEQTENGDENDG